MKLKRYAAFRETQTIQGVLPLSAFTPAAFDPYIMTPLISIGNFFHI
ncbi:hypothetical protein NIES4101_49250 [Calothrix sp. NIES-4101]|nr:hypothetical protein NIES4101_49250 [Calothrix sp. NIES-4101]